MSETDQLSRNKANESGEKISSVSFSHLLRGRAVAASRLALGSGSSTDRTVSAISVIPKTGSASPFYLLWSFGINVKTPIINLTIANRPFIFFGNSHAGTLYNYKERQMKMLPCHRNTVTTIAACGFGKWLVTADAGDDSSVTVWDSSDCTPINTIFDAHPNCGTALVGMSENSKYLVTIGKEDEPIVRFWLWTFGHETSDDHYQAQSTYGEPKAIAFNPNVQEHFMIAFENRVVFLQWDESQEKLLPAVIPEIRHKNTVGTITDCTYTDFCHECVASTTEGCALLFGNTLYTLPFNEASLNNFKIFTKTIKISSSCINCITSVDGLIATADANGHIKFYDKRMRILYWCQDFELPSIVSMSFHYGARSSRVNDTVEFTDDDFYLESPSKFLNDVLEDRSEEFETLYAQTVPSDATLQKMPFVVRDFVISTVDGKVILVDFLKNKYNTLFPKADSPVAALDTHCELNYVCIAYVNGRIALYDFLAHQLVAEFTLPEDTDEYTGEIIPITCLKYSPKSFHLACGRANGKVYFLEPIILHAIIDVQPATGRIIKMAFSSDLKHFAYFDENRTVCLFQYAEGYTEDTRWEFLGKKRPHYKQINDILFSDYLPTRLFTISDDRCLVEYDIPNSGYGNLEILSTERMQQRAIPKRFLNYPKKENVKVKGNNYFLIVDNQYKFKVVNDLTFMIRSVSLGPTHGCYKESPVREMTIISEKETNYLIFSTDKHVGIIKLPMDGNPYRCTGQVGHPVEILEMRVSANGKYIFTAGLEDTCVLMWRINIRSVEIMERIGGKELEPFYGLIEGGVNGWFFKEMQDLFYYMQILHGGENTVLPRTVSDRIPVTELPDLMRACGFYPSEYEIEDIVTDIKYRVYDETEKLNEEVCFVDFVKLYVNHRPAYGVSLAEVEDAFGTICHAAYESDSYITRDSFVECICNNGEVFIRNNAHKCLVTLMHIDVERRRNTEDFTFLPEEITFDDFLEELLGIDMEPEESTSED